MNSSPESITEVFPSTPPNYDGGFRSSTLVLITLVGLFIFFFTSAVLPAICGLLMKRKELASASRQQNTPTPYALYHNYILNRLQQRHGDTSGLNIERQSRSTIILMEELPIPTYESAIKLPIPISHIQTISATCDDVEALPSYEDYLNNATNYGSDINFIERQDFIKDLQYTNTNSIR